MNYRRLGKSGLIVSEIGLGGNNFGWWEEEKISISVINHAIELGVSYIDTADSYDKGRSEEFIGKALKGKRDKVIIATKFGLPMANSPNESGGSRSYIIKAVERSLKRLQTDYIDLYQFHRPDEQTPIKETLAALHTLIQSGKVRYIGCSNFASWQICEAVWISTTNMLESFVTVQSRYNILERQIETELVPCCKAYSLGVIPWGPLAGGFLSGKYHSDDMPVEGRLSKGIPLYQNMFTESNWNKLTILERFCEERGHTIAELSIAWLLAKPWVPTVIAGARKPEQVSANVAASEWKLAPGDISELERSLLDEKK